MFNALVRLSNNLYLAGIGLVQTATRIQGVYLIGSWLSGTFYNSGSAIVGAAIYVNNFRDGLEDFYNETRGSSGGNTVLANLLAWANALIEFISNPYPVIVNIVKGAFSYIEYMYYNAYAFIFPHVIRLLDTYFPAWRDIGGFVVGLIGGIFYEFNTLRYNPVRWVFDRLRSYSGVLSSFLSDPDGWLKERVRIFFPELWSFLQGPSDYILNKLAEKLESFADRYMTRLIGIFEHILSIIF